ncbi:hypothetical protein [Actinomadura roseirufa]|uniref:hypothetical protein n=1 Tax=Actinomadura roseirufa TaxID=2094049 RepID=UPI00104144F6|nr:hypothetical protein [Actinomadura roseirufa]
MTVSAGADPERTRPDQRLPKRADAPPAGAAPAEPVAPVPAAPMPGADPGAGTGGDAGAGARRGGTTWHRYHYAVGAFLVAYGVTALAGAAFQWDHRREELEEYFSSGPVSSFLLLVKAVEVLLVLVTVAGLARRRDLWFVVPLAGWMAGFAMFAVLDVLKGRVGGLLEHTAYLAGFVILLFLSYGLSAKAQLIAAARAGSGATPGEGRLTRTQEFALSAINRLPRR